MITLDQIKETLRQVKELLPHAPHEEASKEIKGALDLGQQIIVICQRCNISTFSEENSKTIEGTLKVIQDMYDKHASN